MTGGAIPVSVRYNPFKVRSRAEGREVAWCRWGRYLDDRPTFALDPLWHAGGYYVQEASSMFVGELAGDWEGLRVLDLCAAPGGKTTLLSTLVGLDGLVVANETIRARAQTLADNVARWGLGNVVVTNNDPSHFAGFREWFDVVLVDAPCSGEGLFRRHPELESEWSEENVELCARRQRRILGEMWGSLRPGGYLIYSTCTFNRTENEANVEWMLGEFGGEMAEVDTPKGVETEGLGYRFHPDKVEGEGFFVAAIRKEDGKRRVSTPRARRTTLTDAPREVRGELRKWVGQPEGMYFGQAGDNFYGFYEPRYEDVRTVADNLSAIYSGVRMGQVFKGKLKPDHALALFHDVVFEPTELPLETVLDYLRKRDIPAERLAEGVNLISCEGHPVGWAKRVGNRVNNLYPNNLRVRI